MNLLFSGWDWGFILSTNIVLFFGLMFVFDNL